MNYLTTEWSEDLLPNYHKYLTFLKKVYRHEFRKNWFQRISTPLFEKKDFLSQSKAFWKFIIDNIDIDIRQKPYIESLSKWKFIWKYKASLFLFYGNLFNKF